MSLVVHFCLAASAFLVSASASPPPLLVHNATLIAAARARIAAGDPSALLAAATAERWAVEALPLGPWAVTHCPHPPPSGDAHDYYSVAKYFWPCNARPAGCTSAPGACNESSGLPWVNCDGLVNPVTNEYALPRISNFTSALSALAAGYTWTGRTDFAARAAVLVRTWFLDDTTRMNPNMNFAQAEPGSNNGSHWGIIELSTNFVAAVLDSIALITPSGVWTAADQTLFLQWLHAFNDWLTRSELGIQEYSAFNNHQMWVTTVRVATAAWLSDAPTAVALLHATLEPPPAGTAFAPLGVQIARGGQLPAEEARTNSAGYVNFATQALLELGLLARLPLLVAAGAPDLLTYVTRSNDTSIHQAVDFMVPFVLGEAVWPFQNLTHTPWSTFTGEYRIAANIGGWEGTRATYVDVVARIGGGAIDPMSLFWPTAWS